MTTFASLKNTKLTETTHICLWQVSSFSCLSAHRYTLIDHPHQFLTESLGSHALIYLSDEKREETAIFAG